MKINKRILSLPPYISTTWHNISALHMSGTHLVVNFIDGDTVEIPGLSLEVIEKIFEMHAIVIEEEELEEQRESIEEKMGLFSSGGSTSGIPFRIGLGGIDGLHSAMQHNPEQMHAPDLPKEILHKIKGVMKVLVPEELLEVPDPEPHCNCVHCQIAREIHGFTEEEDSSLQQEESITESELQFSQWEIHQEGEKLYSVINKLESEERYSVYLGHPVGCTCGKNGCEHIVAVLKS